MVIERILESSFSLFKKYPKIVLPNVLLWIPTALFSLLMFHGIFRFSSILNWEYILSVADNPTTLKSIFFRILKDLLVYGIFTIPIFILSVVINLFNICVYSDIVNQVYLGHKIMLVNAFFKAKSKIVSLSWTYFLEILITLAVFFVFVLVGIIGEAFLILARLEIMALFGIIFMLLGLLIIAIMVIVFFYEVPVIVVVENKSGLNALKRSSEIGRQYFWSIIIIIIILIISTFIIRFSIRNIPHIGFILVYPINLFLTAWVWMTPALLYFGINKTNRFEE